MRARLGFEAEQAADIGRRPAEDPMAAFEAESDRTLEWQDAVIGLSPRVHAPVELCRGGLVHEGLDGGGLGARFTSNCVRWADEPQEARRGRGRSLGGACQLLPRSCPSLPQPSRVPPAATADFGNGFCALPPIDS